MTTGKIVDNHVTFKNAVSLLKLHVPSGVTSVSLKGFAGENSYIIETEDEDVAERMEREGSMEAKGYYGRTWLYGRMIGVCQREIMKDYDKTMELSKENDPELYNNIIILYISVYVLLKWFFISQKVI